MADNTKTQEEKETTTKRRNEMKKNECISGFLSTPLSVAIATITKKHRGHWDSKKKGWVFPKDVAGIAIAEIREILEDYPHQNWENKLVE